MTKGLRYDYVILDEMYEFTTTGFLFADKPLGLTLPPRRLRYPFSGRTRKDRLRDF